jgi:hypothetical protein
MKRTWRYILLAALLSGASLPAEELTPGARHILGEAEAKAAFMLNFARFTDWPAGKIASNPEVPVRIGVLESSDVSEQLQRLSKGFTIKGHPVVVVRLFSPGDASSCQAVYVGPVRQVEFKKYTDEWQGHGLLVVGDKPEMAKWGAQVAFQTRETRLQFVLNRRSAKDQGLTFSAQLLKLAAKIID